ncbi:S9 family peptidase [Nonomuraea roseoviolacea]|uniref:Dipeptidyl aminopeptidase/acylaminoacyl peptidase n=1 Tax=Nonomuraea roseoviolacea subsp. carminata TaxID=160689 RepID=A0ABT1K813_9ACTN|nr:S9 family peptidase [Nonomuraea roseoviolacea]MCP2349566.1 dipeptidyl aminopeptidase/acylaminoacyl peptidase [Nonomuraea roseoviolacea subsp. carminata]
MRRLSLDDLYGLAVPGDPQLRPDGSAVAYTLTTADRETDANVTEIWLAAPGAAPRRLAVGAAPRWSPDGRTLAYLRPAGGPPQIHLLPMDGGEPRVLTSAPLGAGPPVWSPDGTRIAYAGPSGEVDENAPIVIDTLEYKADGAGLLRGLTTHLFVVGVEDGVAVQVTSGDFHAGAPAWAPDGDLLAFTAGMDADRDLDICGGLYLVKAEQDGALERAGGTGVICSGVWWLGGRWVVAGHREVPEGHTRLFALEGDDFAEIETGLDRNVMIGGPGYPGAAPTLNGDDLLFCVRDRGFTHLYRLPPGGVAVRVLPGDQNVSGVSVARGHVAHVASTARSAGDVYLDGDALTDHAPEGVELFRARSRTFTAPDGTPVEAFVLRDETLTEPGPLLLDIHGGPHNAWAPVFDGVHLYHQVLAARGWTVLTVNPRASDGYGEAFYTATAGAWGLSDEGDFLAPLDALIEEGVADPARLAVTGYSYGGYMTCWLTGRTARFAAAVPGGVVVDLRSMAGTADLGHFLSKHEVRGEFEEQSPITHVGGVVTPTLILHGDADDRCPIGQAEQWFQALRERRVPVRLVRYPGGSHLFVLDGRPSHRFDYNERILAWLMHWVSGSPN